MNISGHFKLHPLAVQADTRLSRRLLLLSLPLLDFTHLMRPIQDHAVARRKHLLNTHNQGTLSLLRTELPRVYKAPL